MKVRLSERASADFDLLVSTLDDYEPRAAVRIIGRIQTGMQHLRRYPRSGRLAPSLGESVRIWPTSRWLIMYEVADEAVLILRVVHAARDLGSLEI